MRLTELNPRWIHESVFVFLCPHCRKMTLSCKNAEMSNHDQILLFNKAGLEDEGLCLNTVPMKTDVAWTISGKDFETLSVTPSIDASASGHWHGHITNGEIVGGI